jgi:hypothetical protein
MSRETFDKLTLFKKQFSPIQRTYFLVMVANELSIQARSSYDLDSDGGDSRTLRLFNECQHYVLGILQRFIFEEEVDIELFVAGLSSWGEHPTIGPSVQAAIGRAIGFVR